MFNNGRPRKREDTSISSIIQLRVFEVFLFLLPLPPLFFLPSRYSFRSLRLLSRLRKSTNLQKEIEEPRLLIVAVGAMRDDGK